MATTTTTWKQQQQRQQQQQQLAASTRRIDDVTSSLDSVKYQAQLRRENSASSIHFFVARLNGHSRSFKVILLMLLKGGNETIDITMETLG